METGKGPEGDGRGREAGGTGAHGYNANVIPGFLVFLHQKRLRMVHWASRVVN